MKIGFIGQGFVGKNIADDVRRRGHEVVCYALEPEYVGNKEHIKDCKIVFVAVPTPTTTTGCDLTIVEEAINITAGNAIIIIKSTVLPGTTRKLQGAYPDRIILFSPEFLCESTAAHDAANPIVNVVGLSKDTAGHRTAGETVMSILPRSEHNFIVSAESAEIFKYAHNINGYMRVILSNLLHDIGDHLGADWSDIKSMIDADPMMSPYYNVPVHKSGRGAGGHCFIKDMAAFRHLYSELLPDDKKGLRVFTALEEKNLELLAATGKDQDLVKGVYGTKGVSEVK